jgi:hypothetical protein
VKYDLETLLIIPFFINLRKLLFPVCPDGRHSP